MQARTVSLCMIVKNEQERIAGCLESVSGLVEEIIVVDTGSTDDTRKIAEQYGAIVYTYTWADNFAAARNFSISRAHGDWILILDADEVLQLAERSCFQALTGNSDAEGYYFHIVSFLDDHSCTTDMVIRLFRNKPAYFFKGEIHEQVAGSLQEGSASKILVANNMAIYHYGYLAREIAQKNKYQRNVGIIQKALQNRTDVFLLYCLGLEHLQQNRLEEAAACLEQSLSGLQGHEGYCYHAALMYAMSLLYCQREQCLTGVLAKAERQWPDDANFRLLQGIVDIRAGRNGQAVSHLQAARENGADILPVPLIRALAGDAWNRLGRTAEAEREYFGALRQNPYSMYPLYQLLGLKQNGRGNMGWSEISHFATLEIKQHIAELLRQQQEGLLAAVMQLLCLVELTADGWDERAAAVCLQAVAAWENAGGLPVEKPHVQDFMQICAAELRLLGQGLALQASGVGLLDYTAVPHRIACQMLEIIIQCLCSAWEPEMDFNDERIMRYATSANRQPDKTKTGDSRRIP